MIPSKTADWTMTFLGKEKHSESILYFFLLLLFVSQGKMLVY